MTSTDPIKRLAAIRQEPDVAWAASDDGQRIMHRILNEDSSAPVVRGPRDRTRRIVVSIAAATAVVGVAAGTTVAFTEGDVANQAGCYSAFDPQADTTEANFDDVTSLGAVEACRIAFRATGEQPETSNLLVCVNPSGGRGVFPAPEGLTAEQACPQIGWQPES